MISLSEIRIKDNIYSTIGTSPNVPIKLSSNSLWYIIIFIDYNNNNDYTIFQIEIITLKDIKEALFIGTQD